MQPWIINKLISETYGYTVGVTITALPSVPTNALRALIQVETNDIRMRFDSTNTVTTGVGGGMILHVNTIENPFHIIEGNDLMVAARARCNGTTVSKINVLYQGEGQ